MADVVVIGAGVIGLSCARRLQREGFNVAIVAKDFPIPFEVSDARTDINYTSLWGGAHNRWILPSNEAEAREHDMARTTFQHMEATLAAHPEAGITFMPGIEYLETPPSVCQNLTEKKADELGLRGFRFLEKEELPKNVTWGCEYQTWCVNPMVYCAFLLRQFSYAGGKIHKVDLKSPQEVLALPQYKDARAVVNASGTGFGDPAMFPTRGQTCLVANKCAATVTRQFADGTWSFCVPRNFDGGTVIGGTKEPDNWDTEPSADTRATLLSNFRDTHPQILSEEGEFRVLKDIVGRRPTRRGGPRLEAEDLSLGGKTIPLIHAYGLGGRGFELSWGVAERVLQLAGDHLQKQSYTKPRL